MNLEKNLRIFTWNILKGRILIFMSKRAQYGNFPDQESSKKQVNLKCFVQTFKDFNIFNAF